ncbi:aminodeoxychorismate/anthranilate synthase component 2 [Propionigenium maris DSM 9537]|uniref:Aminodeoxychorismate/anthranilate synthase component 2 n=1 Tax=Propionigenium maris DSM 9537 TaxID=1123000 RepID=A0A9W6LMX5_9FUSO|nr:aminodeoxychorismate/anthranilate synthase component II [Propionigenium maris]GLI55953.1 aminodeoxychorismate/anthranilate synthase component 2 [Propionigenium maris DSM 9537]
MIVLIDNYDSFTYNLFHLLNREGREIVVVRNDKVSVEEIEKMNPEALVISPGPKAPRDAGICLEAIERFQGRLPILGVCLGHQSIGEVFGGEVVRAGETVHGKTSEIVHSERGLFRGVTQNTQVARYHSLIVRRDTLPEELIITAETLEGEIMALRHRDHPIFGLQFHPESLFTPEGDRMIDNFFREVDEYDI